VSLVPALLSLFVISSYPFFCLALVPALYKKFGIGPSVNFYVKKKLTECHGAQSFHATWHTKRQNYKIKINQIKYIFVKDLDI